MGKSAPAPQSYVGASTLDTLHQDQSAARSTWESRPDVTTPWGSVGWSAKPTYDPVSGATINTWQQDVNLDPTLVDANQSQMNLQRDRSQLGEKVLDQASGDILAGSPWQNGNLNQWGAAPTAGSLKGDIDSSQAINQRGVDAAYKQYASRLDPQFQQRESSLESTLANRGLRPGDAAYDAAMQNFGRERTDAYQTAQNNAVGQGAQIGNQMFAQDMGGAQLHNAATGQQYGMDQASANYNNTLRQSQIAEGVQRQGFGLNQVNGLLNGQQVSMPSFPSAAPAAQAGASNLLGGAQAAGSAALSTAQMQNQAMSGLMGGLGSLGGAAMSFSDVRLKDNVNRLGVEALPGIPLASWTWKDSGKPDLGVIAQDVAQVRPDLVKADADSGYLMVDYVGLRDAAPEA